MWSRRAQEYEAKINSGDIVAIAEVVRDLFRSESQPEQSYSERQLYEAALDRLSREIAAVQHVTETEAVKEIEAALAKGPRRGPKPAEEVVEEEAAATFAHREIQRPGRETGPFAFCGSSHSPLAFPPRQGRVDASVSERPGGEMPPYPTPLAFASLRQATLPWRGGKARPRHAPIAGFNRRSVG